MTQLNWYKEMFICKLEELNVVENAYSFSPQELFTKMKQDEFIINHVAEAFECAVSSLVEDSYKMVMEEVGNEVEEGTEATAITTATLNKKGNVELSSIVKMTKAIEFSIVTIWDKEHGVDNIWDHLSVDVDNALRKQIAS